jgi:hypothetical protein
MRRFAGAALAPVVSSEASASIRRESKSFLGGNMAEKVKKLNLQRDYKKYLYFIDGDGNVCHKAKSGEGQSKVLVKNAVDRDNQFLYFIDKEGDVSRSARAGGRKKAA